MRKVTYYAIIEQVQHDSFSVFFPDLPGCTSMGESFEEALSNAQEALGLHLWGMETDNEEIPAPSSPPFAAVPAGYVAIAVTVFPDLVKNEMDNHAVTTTVSIPAWLQDAAQAAGLNYSQVLQQALKELLGI